MSSYSNALQIAVRQNILGANTGAHSVLDHQADDDARHPLIQIGNWQIISDDVSGFNGTDRFLDLHVWSMKTDKEEVNTILDALYSAFHASELTVEGLRSCHVYIEKTLVLEDPEAEAMHGVITLKIHCREE
ncbi:DUF3168 domain-containing protein [Flexibacterium corallicola]|uniref:DUF3168 domain-containing protein n=1 Tax=Flexibacterium corallicola TaxID=3037259 RepID=UPI00286F4954|nr:DUF3168 domain-containing protein [Pseudovibrio sp. M1P-2-3]